MKILALDTTSEFGSIAFVDAAQVVEEELLHSPDGFGHVLFDRMAALLDRHQLDVTCMDAFASASGPGSFTGVRVGLAAVKGLAETLSRPVTSVSNLQALASFGSAPLRATLLDARRGEVYAAVYDASLAIIQPECVLPFPQWLAGLSAGLRDEEIEFISVDWSPFRAAMQGTRFASTPIVEAPRAIAGAIGTIAAELLAAGGIPADPAALEANYVRRSDAELFWKES